MPLEARGPAAGIDPREIPCHDGEIDRSADDQPNEDQDRRFEPVRMMFGTMCF